jgi:hypothetical protein
MRAFSARDQKYSGSSIESFVIMRCTPKPHYSKIGTFAVTIPVGSFTLTAPGTYASPGDQRFDHQRKKPRGLDARHWQRHWHDNCAVLKF